MHETATLHFDLAHLPPDLPFTLHVGAAEYDLHPHTPQSLTRARRGNRALAQLPDEGITHHAGPVRLPADALVLLRVTTPAPGELLDRLVLVAVRVPQDVARAGARRRLARPGTARPLPPKLATRLTDAPGVVGEDVLVDAADHITADDTAAALVFHHLEMVTAKPVPADHILNDVVVYARGMVALAQSIRDQGTSWVAAQEGRPWTRSAEIPPAQAKAYAHYAWSGATRAAARLPLCDALQQAKDDDALSGQCWSVQPGTVRVPVTATARPGAAEATYTTRSVTAQSGVEHRFSHVPGTGDCTLDLKNYFVRWLQVCVEQYGPGGETVVPISLCGWQSSVPTMMSIPLPQDWSSYDFTFDPRASRASITLGGLGRAPLDWSHDGGGILWTGIFDYAIPVLFIALGIAVDQAGAKWTDVAKAAVAAAVSFVEAAYEGPLGDVVTESFSLEDLLEALYNCIGSVALGLITGAGKDALAEFLAGEVTEATLEQATPVLGWVAYAVGAAADLASMAETTAEVIASPATMRIDVDRTTSLAVTLVPDPAHQGTWPLTARRYTITVTYDDGTARVHEATLPATTTSGDIEHVFEDLPAGGVITVHACFYADTGWTAAQGTSAPIPALPVDGRRPAAVVHLTENLVPLTATTTYSFKQKLVVADGGRRWAAPPAATAPTATTSDLDGSNVGSNLGDLGALTLNEARSSLGYVWKASGQGLPLVGTADEPYSGQEYVAQALGDGSTPQDGLKVTAHGRLGRPCLAFAPPTMARPPADGLVLEPDAEHDVMWARAVSLEKGEPLFAPPGHAFGRFTGSQDDLEIHPAGYAVALNGATAKLQILRLGTAVPDAEAPEASLHAGRGGRPGLLREPVALGCSTDTILVAEQAGSHLPGGGLAAFDVKGNPVAHFAGGSFTTALRVEGSARVILLDIAVESRGFVYVLKYLNPLAGPVLPGDYRLDIYRPDGTFLTQVPGLAAARLVVSLWRNVYTLNYEILPGSGRTEPSVSTWIPSTPS